MKYWLLKSEPNVWSITNQKKAGVKGAAWDGKNYQAANNLRKCLRVIFVFLSFKYWKRNCRHSRGYKNSLCRPNR